MGVSFECLRLYRASSIQGYVFQRGALASAVNLRNQLRSLTGRERGWEKNLFFFSIHIGDRNEREEAVHDCNLIPQIDCNNTFPSHRERLCGQANWKASLFSFPENLDQCLPSKLQLGARGFMEFEVCCSIRTHWSSLGIIFISPQENERKKRYRFWKKKIQSKFNTWMPRWINNWVILSWVP